ncbi:MAG: HD domain-containing protein [Halobacteria archaeon]
MGEPVEGGVVDYDDFNDMKEHVRHYLSESVKRDGDRMRWYPWHSSEYRFDHTMGVVNLAERLARSEGGNVDVVRVAALFHDVAKFEVTQEKHADEGAWVARKYLSNHGYTDEFIDTVSRVIKDHTRNIQEEMPLESKLLIEADSIDKIGIAGTSLMIMRVGYESRPHVDVPKMIQRVIDRGEGMQDWLETETAQKLVRIRVERAKTFKDWFEDEI